MLEYHGDVCIPVVQGGVKAPPWTCLCRAAPQAVARRGCTHLTLTALGSLLTQINAVNDCVAVPCNGAAHAIVAPGVAHAEAGEVERDLLKPTERLVSTGDPREEPALKVIAVGLAIDSLRASVRDVHVDI